MDTIFLVLSLFLPRTVLIIYYFVVHQIPLNNVPFIGDVLLTIFIPRALILIYIAEDLGTDSPWFWIHLVVALMLYFKGSKKVKKVWKGE